MEIRRFEDRDAGEVSAVVGRSLREVNIRDYPAEEVEALAQEYSGEEIRRIAAQAHMYVARDGDRIVGTGSIGSYEGSREESILLTIFVLPEYMGQGIGKKIIQALEGDEYFLRASRVVISSSITACTFYEKMGYGYKDGVKVLEEEDHYWMEKLRTPR